MRFDASIPPAELNRCETCGKPKGYKGYRGPECMCDLRIDAPMLSHTAGQTRPGKPETIE